MTSTWTTLRLATVAAVLTVGAPDAVREASESHTITIDGASFTPATLTVRVGDTITWLNDDILAHTATAADGPFDSGTLEPGDVWKYTATMKGLFRYACRFHPRMKGTLRVR